MLLYRPVGLNELRLIYQLDMRAFPPRLPEQPIFYPVLNEGYARQIARDWNTRSETLAGFVTRFSVEDGYVARFERKVVGGRQHEELWVPAEELAEFNAHIEGRIQVVGAHFGEGYQGDVPEVSGLKGKTATEQLVALARTLSYSSFDVGLEAAANHQAVYLNFFFWEQHDFTAEGVSREERDRVLTFLRGIRTHGERASIPLGIIEESPPQGVQ